jgi:hypothetical protein
MKLLKQAEYMAATASPSTRQSPFARGWVHIRGNGSDEIFSSDTLNPRRRRDSQESVQIAVAAHRVADFVAIPIQGAQLHDRARAEVIR